jgi:hypothetical protein
MAEDCCAEPLARKQIGKVGQISSCLSGGPKRVPPRQRTLERGQATLQPTLLGLPLYEVPSTARRKFNSGLSCQRTPHVGPFERFGHGFVEILNTG